MPWNTTPTQEQRLKFVRSQSYDKKNLETKTILLFVDCITNIHGFKLFSYFFPRS
ncbi:MAG: hypothetical protein CJBNEKGG_04489 [Prosthecobacter sp.]|nr:hypothetical protein [Prosthecobacter sp.]